MRCERSTWTSGTKLRSYAKSSPCMPVTSRRSAASPSPASWSRISMILPRATSVIVSVWAIVSVIVPEVRDNEGESAPLMPRNDDHGVMSTAVVILPTGTYRANDFIEAARSLGIKLIIASEERHALLSDDSFIPIDCADPYRSADAIVSAGDHHPIDAVIPVDDAGVMIAAIASEHLGLAHNLSLIHISE